MAENTLCSISGCGKSAKARGWCNTHYEKWRRNGGPTVKAVPSTMLERFGSKYSISDSGCWLWGGAKDQCGYGHFGVAAAKSRKAHRVSYEIHIGKIPIGHHVCHRCDVPSCVNPEHLFLGTHKQNMADRDEKGRTACGENNGKSVITMEIALYIRKSLLSERNLAKELGVHRGTVHAVRSGRTWKEGRV